MILTISEEIKRWMMAKAPDATLKLAVKKHARLYNAKVVLIEDKASGTQLIQQLGSEGMHTVAEAPRLDGDKVMRLHAQTPRFAGGFVKLSSKAEWLSGFVNELLAFPNSKHDDQVDSTIHALFWATQNYTKPIYTKDNIEGLAKLTGSLDNAYRDAWWAR